MKNGLIFEIKSVCQNFRLIGAIHCNNMGSNWKNWKQNDRLFTTVQLTLAQKSHQMNHFDHPHLHKGSRF